MWMLRLMAAAGSAVTIGAGPLSTPPDPDVWSPTIAALASPAGAASGQPHMTVSAKGVLLSWVERSGPRSTLKFVERSRTGWSTVRTAATGTDWFVNWADVPSVLRLDDDTLIAHWLQKSGPDTYAYDVRLSYSNDDGKTWSRSVTPHHDGTQTEHGFASLVPMPSGQRGLGLVWLDGRESFAETDDPAGGSMTLRYAAFDGAWRQTADAAIDDKVCECCSTAVATTSDGVLASFRDRSDSEIRNIAVSRLENMEWTIPAAVHDDGWKTYACPVNGPALSARGRQAAVAWFSAPADEGHAYAAFSEDAGRTWGPPIRLDEAMSIGRVDIELLEDGSAVATWIEFAAGRSDLRARLVTPNGLRSKPVRIAGVGRDAAAGMPRLARYADELVFAWTESGMPNAAGEIPQRVRTAVARLP
jgi:hypothetical protein